MLDTIEKIEHNGRKVKLHFIGFEGNFSALATTRKGTAIVHGKTLEEVKLKALERVEQIYIGK